MYRVFANTLIRNTQTRIWKLWQLHLHAIAIQSTDHRVVQYCITFL